MLKIKSYRLAYFLYFALLATSLLAPLGSNHFIANDADFINHLASLIQAKMAWASGQFPLRTMPLEQGGMLYPHFQFYSPSAYLFGAWIYQYFSPEDPLFAMKFVMGSGLFLSGVYLYRLSDDFVKSKPAALLAGTAYLTAPYYLIVVDHLGNLTECLGLGLIPVALFYSLRCFYFPEKNKTFLQASLAWYLLLTVHVVSFVYTSIFAGLFLILLSFQKQGSLFKLGLAYLFSLCLGAWYLLPILKLSSYFLVATTYGASAHFMHFHPTLSNLLFPGAGITEHVQNALVGIHPSIGWPLLFAFGISLYAYFEKIIFTEKPWLGCLLGLGMLSILFAWSPFDFWIFLPKAFLAGQYSWRWLDQTIWIGALLMAPALCYLFKNQFEWTHALIGILILGASANVWFPATDHYEKNLEDFIQKPMLISGSNTYLLNFNQDPGLVDILDTMQIDPLMVAGKLQTDFVYHIPKPLRDLTNQPLLLIKAKAPEHFQSATLSVLIHSKVIAKKMISPGDFEWHIALSGDSQAKEWDLSLHWEDGLKHPDILVRTIALGGFLKPEETLDLSQTKAQCRGEKDYKLCHLLVPKSIHLLELPVLYYPGMLNISVNGKTVPYQSVLYQNQLIAGITPFSNQMNDIRIEMRGLALGNRISRFAWIVWSFILVTILFQAWILPKTNRI